ncbi:hypothetical protein [Halomonas kalidii]|uniref:DUF4174 domain-containing protein n=1 Tax=Halomonas kalidii TaxID=3043293 RepID=A0ABT6VN73_9GAMM|nr:hypothetical protein [Halomonas kalidii]MDI5934682.1 hypothetical protein [Halomonas kalidii]
MIEIIAIVLALVGILFAFETPRRKFLSIFGAATAKVTPPPARPSSLRETVPRAPVFGATQSGRHPFFIREPHNTITGAQKEARESAKLVFLVIYDQDHPSQSKLYYSLGCFLDYFTTKKLVDDHFVSALVPLSSSGARDLVPQDDPLENALWVVLGTDGQILRRESVYANPDEGLQRVRAVIGGAANA